MKKTILSAAVLFISFNLFAQTKRIAHRSHSGKNSTLILTTADNFGTPPSKYKKADTVVVKKSDTLTKKNTPLNKRKSKRINRKESRQ